MLYVFDWDGTILDSTGKIVLSMQRAIDAAGLPLPAESALRQIIGLGLGEAIRTLFADIDEHQLEQLKQTYSRFYVEADQTPCGFFPGVQETLQQLREQGHRLAVATGKSRRGLDRVLSNVGLQDFFDDSRCADETQSKPHPQMLLELMQSQAHQPAETVMIGDTDFDIHMAHQAGTHSIAVRYGAHPPERLNAAAPMHQVDHFADILAWRPVQGIA